MTKLARCELALSQDILLGFSFGLNAVLAVALTNGMVRAA